MKAVQVAFAAALCVCFPGCLSPVKYATDLESIEADPVYGDLALPGELRDRWWEAYGDAHLNAYIEALLEESPTLEAAYFRLLESRFTQEASGAGYYPSVSLSAGHGGGGRISDQSTAEANWNLGLAASYEVDLWGKVGAQRRIAELSSQGLQDAAESAALSLVVNAVQAWFNVEYYRERRKLGESLLSLLEGYGALVASHYGDGQASGVDVLEQRQQIETLRSTLSGYDAQVRMALQSLRVLSGGRLEPEVGEVLPEAVPVGATVDPKALLERRPDVRQARRSALSADAEVVVAIVDFLPSLKLSASFSFQSTSIVNLFEGLIWNVAKGLTLPLFDGFRNTAALKRAKAGYLGARALYVQAVYEAVGEVESALLALDLREREFENARAQLARQSEILEVAKQSFMLGSADYARVLSALRGMSEASQAHLDAHRDVLFAQIALYRAMGGGGWVARAREAGLSRAQSSLEALGGGQADDAKSGKE